MPVVSIIVAVYNVEQYLNRCIKSLVSQSYSDIEILLMAGLCTDNSLQKCIEWQKKDSRIVIVSRNDAGLGDARNYALGIAKGRYIAYVDADDYIAPNYIEDMVMPLEKDASLDITCCGYHEVTVKGAMLHTFLPRLAGKYSSNFPFFLQTLLSPQVWLRMYRTEWLKTRGIYMYNGSGEDNMLSYLLAAQVSNIYFVPQALYYYCVENENSLMHHPETYYNYPKAYAAAINYLILHNKYIEVREYIKKDIISFFHYILVKTLYNPQLLEACNQFIFEYFPELTSSEKPLFFHNVFPELFQKPIVLFGAGITAQRMINQLDKSSIWYIVDNDSLLHGTTLEGIPILSIQQLMKDKTKVMVVITSIRFFYDISLQLEQSGITNYISGEEFLLLYKEKEKKS